ncbi:D-tyrosyl-tRNA(Tyr) deacylase [Thermodesulfitimonas autotrophica]|uniref:D-aminoacyl-tRNA deacylase n=1 Tax=Thermodesulfitimonas autotrophica TaxID=1894989 RepID=A0A3N5BVC8_9THEO|nr:D-aminoacyl-tRNA deacylase [Thermodesulfitimonas autotrophica]RPF49855.1 D-tyrosyl-tRNA(Tyr) deacylase [Thermodesulfitimonas autotrophica]
MRAVVQRVTRGAVHIEGHTYASIGPGLVVLVGIRRDDTPEDAAYLAEKIAHLRVFEDREGKLSRSVLDVGGTVLVVSQFTLYGDCRRGRRPSFTDAAPPAVAEPLYRRFIAALNARGVVTAEGRFQARMLVEIANDGPVTLILESERKKQG